MPEPEKKELRRTGMIRLLDELDSSAGHSISFYFPPDSTGSDIQSAFKNASENIELPQSTIQDIEKLKNGAVVFWGENHRLLVIPPFPVPEKTIIYGYETKALRNILDQELTIGIVIIRLGSYGIGVFKQEELLASKVGTGLVHSRHSKGGSSSNRYARHREKQIEYFFTNVCMHAREKLEPYSKQMDLLYYGGESNTVRAFVRQCEFMSRLDIQTADRLLNIREPKQKTLLEAIAQIWSSKVIRFEPPESL